MLQQSASLAGPMGIDPLLAIAMFGAAGSFGLWTPPKALGFVTETWIWISFAMLALLLKLGRSSKVTKPIAEAIGTLESVGGMFFLMLALGALLKTRDAAPTEAGLLDGGLLMMITLSTVGSLVVFRTALDILIWISPIPFIDFLFQAAKTVTTIALVLLAIFTPKLAVVVNLGILLVTALTFRWALRAARWGLVVIWDLTLGRLSRRAEIPRDPLETNCLGPLLAFVIDAKPLARRSACWLILRSGRWHVIKPRALRKPLEVVLGDAQEGEFTVGWTGTILAFPEARVLLPPRHAHLAPALAKETGCAFRDTRLAPSRLRTILNVDSPP